MGLRRGGYRARVLAPFGLWAFGSVLAGPAANDPSPIERIDRGLTGVMWMVKNAESKLRNGVMDPGDGLGREGAATPAVSCCARNLERMRLKLEDVARATSELKREVVSRNALDAPTLDVIAGLESDAAILMRSFGSFETAPSTQEAEAGIRAMTGAFVRTRESADELFEHLGYERPADDAKDGRRK